MKRSELARELVEISLEWQKCYGVAPHITGTLSEYDAAMLVGMPEDEYQKYMENQTAVARGHDFIWKDKRYQIKGNRPSGRPGSRVTNVPKARNYRWDILIWILYNSQYEIEEAWLWEVADYKNAFKGVKRISPTNMRNGEKMQIPSS